MARLAVVLFILSSAVSALGQTAPACPWVSSGTAERLLGGEVTLIAHVAENAAGSCSFVRKEGARGASIKIVVGPTDTHPCPQDSLQLKALGNEALQCRHSVSPSQQSDQIAGRIRKVFFVVTMTNIPGATTQEPTDPRLANYFSASPIERLAEQVVGNLY